MNVNKPFCISSVLGCLLLAQAVPAQAFDNSSFTGCYVISQYGNILGPEINVDPTTRQLTPNFEKLVLHGNASVGRVCSDGAGNLTELSATQNLAGLCSISYTGTGTYTVLENGTGTATATLTIPFDAVLPDGCALLGGVQAGDQATFDFSLALDGQGCVKVIGLSVVTATGPVPIVSEGEACQQLDDNASTP